MKRKIIVICTCILIIIISVICILRSLNLPKLSDVYTYNVNSNISYDVFLKENNFMNMDKLGENNIYISDLVNYIKMNYIYNFDASSLSNLEYDYNVFATLNIDYSTTSLLPTSNLYKKRYNLISNKHENLENSKNFALNIPVSIDYNFYNNEVKKFKEQFSNIPIKAYLVVEFVINSNLGISNSATHTDSMSLKLDLEQPIFSISKSYNKEESNNIPEAGINSSNINRSAFVCSIILFSFAIVIFFTIIKKYSKDYYTSNYKLTLYKILKNNKNIIAKTLIPVDETNLKIITILEFDDLLDIENELKTPIIFYEDTSQAVFTIISNNIAYKYVLRFI